MARFLPQVPSVQGSSANVQGRQPLKALILTADKFEDSEVLVPLRSLGKEDVQVEVASVKGGEIVGKHGHVVRADKTLAQVHADQYDILILPGGEAPSVLRNDKAALEIARSFFRENKPVAAICHGPQILISAGLLKDRRVTCYRSVADEMKQAGARYEDSEVVVDGNLITSRRPADLPAFIRELIRMLKQRR